MSWVGQFHDRTGTNRECFHCEVPPVMMRHTALANDSTRLRALPPPRSTGATPPGPALRSGGCSPAKRSFDTIFVGLFSAFITLATSCEPSHQTPLGGSNALTLVPCFVEGARVPAKCGTLRVPEDRNKRPEENGRTIDLQVVVIPALAQEPSKDPIFFLAGGPGQAATQIVGFALSAAERLREKRDFVFVDQRGTGHSNGLFCEALPDNVPLAEHFEPEFDVESVKRCRDDQNADLRMYTTSIAMDDLNEVRKALGYQTINLWGISYGTRAALSYLRQHEGSVRAVVLDGVAPLSMRLPVTLAKDAERALNQTFEDCANEPTCRAAFPNLKERFQSFIAKLDQTSITTTVEHPIHGAKEELTIDKKTFVGALRGMLYSAEIAALLPLALDRAIRGDFQTFIALAHEMGSSVSRSMATGMFLSVVCSEDSPFIAPGEIEEEAKGTVFGPDAALEIEKACSLWPKGDVPKSFRDPVVSDVPVLLLSGALDPVTPPSWAENAKGTLRRSVSATFSGTGHNTTVTSCARRVVSNFLLSGTEQGLDTSCAESLVRPPFFATFAGAP